MSRKWAGATPCGEGQALLQLIDRRGQALLARFDVAPDVAVALVAGGLLGVLHAFLFREFPQKRMSQDVRRDRDPLARREMGVGLCGHALQDQKHLRAAEALAGAGREEGTSPFATDRQPFG